MRITAIALVAGLVLLAAVAARPGPAATTAPTTHEVRMLEADGAFRFEPAELTIAQGDSVRFVMVSGAPHNVAFRADELSAAARSRLAANMSGQISPLAGPLLTRPGETYVIAFAGMPAGEYEYVCLPHLAMDMKATITVRP